MPRGVLNYPGTGALLERESEVEGATPARPGQYAGMDTDKIVTGMLKDAGIKGTKYLDQGSRGAGEGTYNYVVFDPKDTAILKTMGIGGAGAALAEKE